MKEYIKLFNDLQSADGYIIEDIPFTSTVKREEVSLEPQNVRCNVDSMGLKVKNDTVKVIKLAPLNTILHLKNGTDVELTATTITSAMTKNYKYTLVGVEIGRNVTNIGYKAFGSHSEVTSVTISDSVTSIGATAFANCKLTGALIIPDSVTSIAESAFHNCSGLTEITCKATVPPTIGSSTFNSVPKGIPVYVPSGSISAYQVASYWSEFTNFQSIPTV